MSSIARTRIAVALIATAALLIPTTAASAAPASGRGAASASLGTPRTPSSAATAASAGTHFLDGDDYLSGFSDRDWYDANVPLVDLPDQQIQDVYYYRWRVYREHLRYTNPTDGYVSTEFLDCCGYAAPYQAIDAAAGHHITEGRWARDTQYGDDEVAFWLTGPGASAKPATEDVNPDTIDWAHEYSFWLASAAYGRAQVTGDFTQLKTLLPQLVAQYRGWDGQYDADLGLYWSVPVWDAMEFAAPGYYTADPYHGGDSYRATLNSYQYGDATAIAAIATLAGQTSLAAEYTHRASALKSAMTQWLWDPDQHFFYSILRDDNPSHARIPDREQVGYLPWMFGAADASQATAWAQLTDPQGFGSSYGPTTLERRSDLFMKDAGSCCRWDGPSWPFSTSQTLTGMAALLHSGQQQSTVDAAGYAAALRTYALTQYKNGEPYVAEAHDPDTDSWIYDGQNHSEDYNHSSYVDLVLSGLVGIEPQTGSSVSVQPLIPADWTHFAAENVPYHGHLLTVVWDADGSAYGHGAGLRLWLDGKLIANRATLGTLSATVPTAAAPASTRLVNDAANPLGDGYPKAIASYTWRNDRPESAIDGKVFFSEVPEDTRWTNYSSPNAQDWLGVDFGLPTPVSDIRWYGYDDGGGVRPAADYRLQYLGAGGWTDVPQQSRSSATPVGNGLNRITFPALTTTAVRLLFTNPPGAFVGVTELESWSPSSAAASVTVSPSTSFGDLLVDGTTTVKVTARNTSTRLLTAPKALLTVPTGWHARLVSRPAPPLTTVLPADRSATWTFALTPPADAAPGSVSDVVATVAYRPFFQATTSTHARVLTRIAFPAGPTAAIAHWPTDEATGTVLQDAVGDADLALAGDVAHVVDAGHAGVQFSGAGQSADSAGPVLDTAASFTVSAWVRLDSTAGFATAVSQDGDGTSAFFLQYSGADGRFGFSTEQGRALADAAPEVGRWYHLVGVHDANAATYTLYVDGVAQQSVLTQRVGPSSTGVFAIGRALAGGNRTDWWPGAVSDVTVWQRALAAGEVAAL